MKISVVIIVRNEEKRIRQCLESLLQQKGIDENEIIVVDGLSSDKTSEIVKEFSKVYDFIKLVECNSYGYSYQRNIGANNASGEYILYISGDTYSGPNLIQRYMKIIEDEYDVVQGTIVNIGYNNYFSKLMAKIYPLFYCKHINTDCEEFSTVNVLIRKRLILDRNFNETLNSFEDKEWYLNFYKNVKFKRLKGAVVYHLIHESFFQYTKKIHREAIALGKIVNKARKEKVKEKLNFFNWLNYSNSMGIAFLAFAILIIVIKILELNLFLYLVPILALISCPIIYIRSIVKTISPFSNRIFSGLVVFAFIISVVTGVVKGHISNILTKRGSQ